MTVMPDLPSIDFSGQGEKDEGGKRSDIQCRQQWMPELLYSGIIHGLPAELTSIKSDGRDASS